MEHNTLADDLLSEIQGESLQSLLTSLQDEVTPLGATGIPTLDAQLTFRNPRKTSQSPLNRGDVLEIQASASSGKSYLTYLLVIACILPQTYRSLSFPGWDKSAVVYDTEGTFDISRLHHVLRTRIHQILQSFDLSELPEPIDECVETIARQCLPRLFVCRPTSTFQLATSILHFPDMHAENELFQKSEVALLVVDSLSSFYWNDRFTMEQFRGQKSGASPVSNPLKYVLDALQHVRNTINPVMVLTNWGLNPLNKPSPDTGTLPSPFYKQHLHLLPSLFAQDASEHGQMQSNIPSMACDTPISNVGELMPPEAQPRPAETFDPESRLAITHHITLQSSFPSVLNSDAIDRALEHWEDASHVPGKCEVQGYVKTPGVSVIGRFSFTTQG
ncbi:unnamed protein product [Somion occarium]|uniref:DNA recombination and repair protein Rad51-like C-terminal domain-containing protein n=1 Tax=Somion occarium TaxID=3059160 RepID=A0ABP1CI33_9APHY